MNNEKRRKALKYMRKLVMFLLDVVLVVLAIELATALRYDGSLRSKEYIYMISKVRPLLPFFTALYMGGLVLGRTFGTKLAGKAQILGGAILVLIGLEIFITGWF